ncbi:MAG: hypothetical protein Q9221_001363 [Calogaya cf. arnoldii]
MIPPTVSSQAAIVPIRSKTFNYYFLIPRTSHQLPGGEWAEYSIKDSERVKSDTEKMRGLWLLLHSRITSLASLSKNIPGSECDNLRKEVEKLGSKARGWSREMFGILNQYEFGLPLSASDAED